MRPRNPDIAQITCRAVIKLELCPHKAARIFGLHPRTLYHWMSQYRGGTLMESRSKTPRPLQEDVCKLFIEMKAQSSSVHLKELKDALAERLGINVCLSTVHNWLAKWESSNTMTDGTNRASHGSHNAHSAHSNHNAHTARC